MKYIEEYNLLASGSRDSTINLIDIKSGKIVRKLYDEHNSSIWSLEYLKNYN